MRAKLGVDFAVQTCEHSANHINDITDTRYQAHKHLHTLQNVAFPYGVRLAHFVLPYGVRLVRFVLPYGVRLVRLVLPYGMRLVRFVLLCGMRLVLW